jgi:hypothetical protein
MSLRNLIKRIYDTLTQPLYNRLLSELKSASQMQLQTQVESQTDLMEQVIDELSAINLQLAEFRESPSELSDYLRQRQLRMAEIEARLSSETIYSVITELDKRGLQHVVNQYQLSASAAMHLSCRYHGMNAGAIERVRRTSQDQILEKDLSLSGV